MVAGGSPPAGTVFLAVSPKRAPGTGSLALVSGPASRAEAAARVPVTEAAVETPAAVLAAGSEAPWEALLLTGQAGPALWAGAVA